MPRIRDSIERLVAGLPENTVEIQDDIGVLPLKRRLGSHNLALDGKITGLLPADTGLQLYHCKM